MIELPEARVISRDLKKEILGKQIVSVRGDFVNHKFTFYGNNPEEYDGFLLGKKVTGIIERNFYIEIEAEDYKIIFRDGANIRYYNSDCPKPDKSKLLIQFKDGAFINVTVAMYAFISVFDKNKETDNIYYNMELEKVGALDKRFTYEYFNSLINETTIKLSAKAFLATEQRILGIGNGVVQDILFNANVSPRTKISTLLETQIRKLYDATIDTIAEMINKNGRDTEKDIYGNDGGYKTIMSNKNFKEGCPTCKGEIKKENFLGGSVYYCPTCQK